MLIGDRASNGKTYYYLLDAQESVVAVTDSSGNVLDSYVYDPYGNVMQQNETVANPWQFESGYQDGSTGLIKFGARYYNPSLVAADLQASHSSAHHILSFARNEKGSYRV